MPGRPSRITTVAAIAAVAVGVGAVAVAVEGDGGGGGVGASITGPGRAGPTVARSTPAPAVPNAPAWPPPGLPARVATPGSGPLGLKWSWAQPETFPYVARAAGGWTFAEVEWCAVETRPGHVDWSEVDRVVRRARTLGHRTMLKLRTGRCWATELPSTTLARDRTENVGKDPSTPALDPAAHRAFVRAVVQRYGARGVDHYAVENEPDTVNHWAASIADYEQTVRRVARTIRRTRPGAHVVDGGVSSTAYGVAMAAARMGRAPGQAVRDYRAFYARRLAGDVSRFPAVSSVRELRAVLRTPGARRAIGAVRVAVELANAGVVDGYQLHFYEPAGRLRGVLRFLDRRLRRGVRVEPWEIGSAWPGSGFDQRRQATELFRTVALLLADDARPIVHLPVAYSAAPGKQQVFRGLTDADGTVLAPGRGWVALSRALVGLGDRPVRTARGRLAGAVWRVGGRTAALVWARRGRVALDATDVRRVVDPTGARVAGPPVVGRRPVLVLGSAGGQLARTLLGARR